MNLLVIHGRLTRDPEIKFYNGEKSVCSFDIAVDRGYRDKDGNKQTDYFRCTSFGKQGETIDKFFKKGSGILVRGEMQNNRYTVKDGAVRDGWQVVVREFDWDFKSSGKEEKSGGDSEFYPIEEDVEDDDLPF